MFRIRTCVCVLSLLALPAAAQAGAHPSRPLGIGLEVGEPTGITAEYYPRSPGFGQAVELTIGLDTFDHGHFYGHLIWKFYLTQLVRGASLDVPIYVGLGPWLAAGHGPNDGSVDVGGRMPFGIALDFRSVPLQIFFEIALNVELVHDFGLGVDGALGFRYYF